MDLEISRKMCVFLRLPSLFSFLYLALFHRPMSGRRPREQRHNSPPTKVLFVNIFHRHWLFSARGFPREFSLVPFRSPSYWLSCSAGSPKRSWRFGVHFVLPPARIPPSTKKIASKAIFICIIKKNIVPLRPYLVHAMGICP